MNILAQFRSESFTTSPRPRSYTESLEQPDGAVIDEAERRLEQIRSDLEIARDHQMREQLYAERKEIETRIDKYKAILSPIRRCPPELLSEIFLRCCQIDSLCYTTARRAPILLTRICRYWRNIVLSTPRLWASINVALGGEDEVAAQRAQGITAWLQRAGSLVLSISLGYGPFNQEHGTDLVMDAILKFAHRCESLDLQIYPRSISRLERASLSFHHLKHLRVMLGGFDLRHPMSAFASAPMLKAVKLENRTSNFRLPWSQITRLSLDPFDDDSWETLALCEELVELRLRVIRREVHARSFVILKKVEILQLTSYEFVDQVLNAFKLPALRDFTCFATCTPDTFTSFATRSGFNLDKITLGAPSRECLVRLLQDSPSVSHLSLLFPTIPDLHLEDLEYVEEPSRYLAPRLEKLTLFANAYWTLPAISKLVAMIRSRCNGIAQRRLREVQLDSINVRIPAFDDEKLVEFGAAVGVRCTFGPMQMPRFGTYC